MAYLFCIYNSYLGANIPPKIAASTTFKPSFFPFLSNMSQKGHLFRFFYMLADGKRAYHFFAINVTMLLQFEISVMNISESAEILLNLQTKCNEYFHVTKHL